MANLTPTEVRQYANIFAEAFKQSSVFTQQSSGSSGGYSSNAPDKKQNQEQKKYTKNLAQSNSLYEDHHKAIKRSTKSLEGMKVGMGKAVSSMLNMGKMIALAVTGMSAKQLIDDYKSSMKYAISGLKGHGDHLQRATDAVYRFGTTLQELNELEYATRRTTIAMGGYTKWAEKIKNQHADYFPLLGGVAESTKYLANQMDIMATSAGMNPKNIEKYNKEILLSTKQLHVMGTLLPEQQEILKETLELETVRSKIVKANSFKERMAIIKGIKARQVEMQQMGMSTEAIKKNNKTLNDINNTNPLDRSSKAISAQIGYSYGGRQKEGARLAKLLREGREENSAEIASLQNDFADRIRALKARGREMNAQRPGSGMGLEIRAGMMEKNAFTKLGMNISDYGVGQRKAIKLTDEQLTGLVTNSIAESGNKTVEKTVYYGEIMQNLLMKNNAVTIAIYTLLDSWLGKKTALEYKNEEVAKAGAKINELERMRNLERKQGYATDKPTFIGKMLGVASLDEQMKKAREDYRKLQKEANKLRATDSKTQLTASAEGNKILKEIQTTQKKATENTGGGNVAMGASGSSGFSGGSSGFSGGGGGGANVAIGAGAINSSSTYSGSSAGVNTKMGTKAIKNSEFVAALMPQAIAMGKKYGIDPQAIIAHAALETGFGKKMPRNADGTTSFNFFGMKPGRGYKGAVTKKNATNEFRNGRMRREKHAFRSYGSAAEGLEGYENFVTNNGRGGRYTKAGVTDTGGDPIEFFKALKKGGWATDNKYVSKLSSTYNAITDIVKKTPSITSKVKEDADAKAKVKKDEDTKKQVEETKMKKEEMAKVEKKEQEKKDIDKKKIEIGEQQVQLQSEQLRQTKKMGKTEPAKSTAQFTC